MGSSAAVGKSVVVFLCLAIWVSTLEHVSATEGNKVAKDMTKSMDVKLLDLLENAIDDLGKREEEPETNDDPKEQGMEGRDSVPEPDGQDEELVPEDLKDLDLLTGDRDTIPDPAETGGQDDGLDIEEEVKRNGEEEEEIKAEDDTGDGDNLDKREGNGEPAEENNKGDMFEGDLDLTDEQKAKLKALEINDKNTVEKRKFIKVANKWPGGIVYYHPFSVPASDTWRRAIEAGMNLVKSKTCIRFASRTSGPRVNFARGRGCFSSLGMINRNSGQTLNIQSPGCTRVGTVAHEILHALGFLHEQSRPDRDNYVTVNFNNIQAGKANNFKKYAYSAVNTAGLGYDVGSVMHYGGKAFAKDSRYYTITAKQSSQQSRMGQRTQMSAYDIAIVNKLYCGSTTPTTTSKPPACQDRSSSCQTWKGKGFCRLYVVYGSYCRKTCHGCKGTCTDSRGTRQCGLWKSKYCNSNAYVQRVCKKTCNRCDGSTSTTSSCADHSSYASRCSSYKARGYCKYYNWYTTLCKKTCHACKGTCTDSRGSKQCGLWKSKYCNSNAYVQRVCKKTCNRCDGSTSTSATSSCADHSSYASRCSSYKARGYCKYYNWYTTLCKKTCHSCKGTCTDSRGSRQCGLWKSKYCNSNTYVQRVCKRTCNRCA